MPPPAAPAEAAPLPGAGKVEASDESTSFTSVEQAQAALARAEQELLALHGEPSSGAGAPKAPTSAPADRAAEAEKKAASEPKQDQAPADPCSGLCRAFGSLSRAANAICRLAGETDERCTRAKGSVRENSQRVAHCRCSAP